MAGDACLFAAGVGAVYFWMRTLRNSDAMANNRRDALIATLAKTD